MMKSVTLRGGPMSWEVVALDVESGDQVRLPAPDGTAHIYQVKLVYGNHDDPDEWIAEHVGRDPFA